jgi:hypothetical protein
MNKIIRLAWTGIAVIVAVRLLDWLLFPALPLLLSICIIGVVLHVVVNGRRGL